MVMSMMELMIAVVPIASVVEGISSAGLIPCDSFRHLNGDIISKSSYRPVCIIVAKLIIKDVIKSTHINSMQLVLMLMLLVMVLLLMLIKMDEIG